MKFMLYVNKELGAASKSVITVTSCLAGVLVGDLQGFGQLHPVRGCGKGSLPFHGREEGNGTLPTV